MRTSAELLKRPVKVRNESVLVRNFLLLLVILHNYLVMLGNVRISGFVVFFCDMFSAVK